MISAMCENRVPVKVLEVGAGCGYQSAVLAQFIKEVHAIERIRGLYDVARERLRSLKLIARVRLGFGDGMAGLPGIAPFRSEEHTSELQSLMRISYAVFCLKKNIY